MKKSHLLLLLYAEKCILLYILYTIITEFNIVLLIQFRLFLFLLFLCVCPSTSSVFFVLPLIELTNPLPLIAFVIGYE